MKISPVYAVLRALSPLSELQARAGAIKSAGQLTALPCPEGASENSPAFQRRASGSKAWIRPEGRLMPRSVVNRPFGTRISFLAPPALKRRVIVGCPSGTELPICMPGTFNRTRNWRLTRQSGPGPIICGCGGDSRTRVAAWNHPGGRREAAFEPRAWLHGYLLE